jgi:CRP/FNR family transcriptional regulator, cyclic AMP receptor protein
MIPLEEMKEIPDFDGVDEEMLDEIASIGEMVSLLSGTYLFKEGDRAETYYILKEGKVVLEFKQSDGSILTETVGPGMGVGCSSLAGLMSYASDARCEGASRFLCWSQAKLRHLFNEHARLGYAMMKACAMSLNRRVAGKL